MNLSFPALPGAVGQALNAVRRAFLTVVTTDAAAPHLLLQAPSGKVFRVSVTDAGALAATEV